MESKIILLCVVLSVLSVKAENPEGSAPLRGYGKVSSSKTLTDKASILEITCEDESKAQLLQAKYLSDIQLLLMTNEILLDGKVNGVQIKDQGFVVALRMNNIVQLIASESKLDLIKTIKNQTNNYAKEFSSSASTKVPMWLDRWDKYGFRFYYRPWTRPRGKTAKTYNNLDEFEFAEDKQKSGFVFWARKDALDTAEGIINYNSWEWAFNAASEKQLPVGINLAVGSPGSTWFTNRYREQMAQKAPQFCGNFHGVVDPQLGATGFTSWNSTTGRDAQLGILQEILRKKVKYPNITTILEPHGEPRHGDYDLFMEHGPVADKSYQKYLKTKYSNTEELSKAWGVTIDDWDKVRVPELAEFLGWGPQAFDLTGAWRVGYEKYANGKTYTTNQLCYQLNNSVIPTEGAPKEWFNSDFDDSSWPSFTAPGNDKTMFLHRRPAVYRQTITVPEKWLSANKRTWLYVWDLNSGHKNVAQAYVNGTLVGESTMKHAKPHWMSLEVTKELKAGENTIALRLPKGYLAYRVYLSHDEPKQYPNLGLGRNAQWCDFSNWISWSRLETIKRGLEMIRQVDPNRQIDLMAPLPNANDTKKLALKYGANFKDTGFMGVCYADALPALMRGARLPLSLEPGTPAYNLNEFEKMMGLYATEGIQAIDYFIHIGSIMWHKEIKKEFEDTLPMIKLIGKYHSPKAEVAALYSTSGSGLTGYPWGQDHNTNLGSGYWRWNVRAPLNLKYESDAVTESSFENGEASRYKAIIDTNTSIMDEDMVSGIEKYVKDGGTFITFVQTGRHTPLVKNSWPISRLTGYKVTKIDTLDTFGNPIKTRAIKPAKNQSVIHGSWKHSRANGMSLEKVADDTQDLMNWEDGSVAIGSRKLGKGYIIQIGCKFSGKSMFDRIDSWPSRDMQEMLKLFSQILESKSIKQKEYKMAKDDHRALLRHYVSNNGLYDIWVAWNRDTTKPFKGEFSLPQSVKSTWAWNVYSQSQVQVIDNKIAIDLKPHKYRVFMTPRKQITSATDDWFQLQRDWWRGTAEVSTKKLPSNPSRFTMNLRDDWAFKPLTDDKTAESLIGADIDDSKWDKIKFSAWSVDYPQVKHALLRKTFTIPEDWVEGNPTLWVKGWNHWDYSGKGRVWLDGKLISDWGRNNGVTDYNPSETFKRGTTHVLVVEIKGEGGLIGPRGNVYIYNWPKPDTIIDLAGDWKLSEDVLRYDKSVKIPGKCKALSLKRKVVVPEAYSKKNIMIDVKASGPVVGIITNGHYIRRLHHIIDDHFQFNITPYINFGASNEIEVIVRRESGDFIPHDIDIKKISLNIHDPKMYP
ncbi:MAG: beta-galactosidase trimerization domain-containing protein [Lentisphaeraceae bacterium]|nr:beta-galactosidase trimerization domain-containing protein [Lentisphaeraceae bacterium]